MPSESQHLYETTVRRHCQQKQVSHRRDLSIGQVHRQSFPHDQRICCVRLAWRGISTLFESPCREWETRSTLGSDASMMQPVSCRRDAAPPPPPCGVDWSRSPEHCRLALAFATRHCFPNETSYLEMTRFETDVLQPGLAERPFRRE